MRRIISLFFSFSIFCISSAQDTLVLNLQEAIKIALDENINLKQQENFLEVTKAIKLQSEAAYLPNLNIINTYAKNTKGRQFSNELSQMVNTSTNNLGYTLASNVLLFNGLYRLNFFLQSVYQHKAQLSLVEQTKQNTIFNIANQYLQVLLDEELIKITSENLAVQKIVLDQIRGYVDVNIKAISEQYTQEAQTNLAEVQLMMLKNQLLSDKSSLALSLMLVPGTNFKLAVPDWGIEKTLMEEIELDSLWEIAKSHRQDLKQLEQTNKTSFYNIKLAQSALYPTLGIFYNYSSSYDDKYANPLRTQLLSDNPTHILGLSLTVPIFNRFQTRTTIVNAKVNYENNLLNYQKYQNTVYSQIQNAYNNFLMYKESYKATVLGYNAAKLSFEKYTERFNLGIGNNVEFSQASQIYIQAQSSKAQAEYTLLFQKVIIDYYTGTLNNNDLFYK